MKIKAQIKNNLINHDMDISQYEGKTVSVEIKLYRKTRTNEQNDYYWGVIIEHCKQIFLDEWMEAMTPNKVHDALRIMFLYAEIIDPNTGAILRVPKSTKQLNTAEFVEYIDTIRVWAKDYFNCIIPLPNEHS